jgi:type II secretory pathway pseudopilin PulG
MRAQRQRGFTYIAVLVAMLMLSLATQGVMTYVSHQAQREREADLLRIGQTYAKAIGAYYQATPGSVKRWPAELEDLLEDRRLVAVVRHMREVYPDPIARTARWDLIRAPDGGIAGVRSISTQAPIRMGEVVLDGMTLPPATRYADWDFVYVPALVVAPEIATDLSATKP